MKKKYLVASACIILILSGCSQSNDSGIPISNAVITEAPTATPVPTSTHPPTPTPIPAPTINTTELTKEEIPLMYTNPDNYKNRYVSLKGKVFSTPEYHETGVYFQMFQDYENNENNTIVYSSDTSLDLKKGDYVQLIGIVQGTFTGTNALGGTIIAPSIECSILQTISYMQLTAPAKAIKIINESITQNGYEVILEKIEFADSETRLYITVNNNGKANFNLYDFNAKIVQNKKQYEYDSNWEADYPKIQTDLMPDVTTSGIICFPKLDPDIPMTVHLDGYSDSFREDFELYTYKID